MVAAGERPDRDEWTLTLMLPEEGQFTALRIDCLPKATAGGEWPDQNIVLSELAVDLVQPKGLSNMTLRKSMQQVIYCEYEMNRVRFEIYKKVAQRSVRNWR